MQCNHAQELNGCRVLMTRTQAQNKALAQEIERRAGVGIAFPCLQLEYIRQAIADGLQHLANCSDVIFTSSNAVAALQTYGIDNPAILFAGKRLAVVGEKTAAALQAWGVAPDIVAKPASQAGLLAMFQSLPAAHSVLFFRAEQGADTLASFFNAQHIPLVLSCVYRTVCPSYSRLALTAIRQQLAQGQVDAVLLGSPKVARHYQQLIADNSLANRPVLVSISEQVTCAARDIGLKVRLTASETSFCGMLDILARLRNQQ